MTAQFVFVLGMQKCGTTSLASLLASHPKIFLPSIKETYFFCEDERFEKGTDWYFNEFYAKRPEPVFCDATPFYAVSSTAIERLSDFDTDASRYVLMLRNPIDRAYSAYWHQVRLGYEQLTFEEALEAENQRVIDAKARNERWWRHAYTTVGLYSDHIERLYDAFGKDRLLILDQSSLKDPISLCTRLSTFLNLSNEFNTAYERENTSSMPKSALVQNLVTRQGFLKKIAQQLLPRELRTALGRRIIKSNSREFRYPPMQAETRARLESQFRDSNEKLAAMGFDFAADWIESRKAK